MSSSISQFEAVGLALAGYTFWVLADTSLKVAGASVLPAYEITTFVGLSIAAVLLLHGLWRGDVIALWPKDPTRQFFRSLLDLANGVYVVIALRHVPLALFYILVFCSPMVITLMAALFLGEPLERKKGAAIVTGFIGVVIAVRPFGLARPGDWTGYVACMVCVLSFSANMVWSRVMTQTESPESLTFFSGAVMAVLGAVAMLRQASPLTPRLGAVLAAAGLFCVFGSLCFFVALKHTSAATVSQYHYSQLPSGALIAYLTWHEGLSRSMLLGAALIIGSGCYTAANSYHDPESSPKRGEFLMQVLLGIDVGKTNIRVGVFSHGLTLLERWATSSCDVLAAQNALRAQILLLRQTYEIGDIGISIFGPLQVDPSKQNFGALIESSEAAWSDVNIPALVSSASGKAVFFDYDVNAGALAEATVGTGKDVRSFVYLSVGTGLGGVHFRGTLVPGYAPQLGHMYLPREADDLDFAGSCRFHGACLQGLASGKAMSMRWNQSAEELEPGHAAWNLEARYLARACANLIYTFSPERIVLGSSVGSVPNLTDQINAYLNPLLNGFLEPELRSLYAAQAPITRAALVPDSSLIGAVILAKNRVGLCLSSDEMGNAT